jgi:hypothetical protein
MITRKLLLVLVAFFTICSYSDGQGIFKKLRKKAGEIVTGKENKDSLINNDSGTAPGPDAEDCIGAANPAKDVKTDLKKEFYTEDVMVEVLNEKNVKMVSYFDADALAMKTVQPESSKKASYMDSEGFFYAYNEHKSIYEKSSMLSMGAVGLTGPSMMVSQYKLPNEPFWTKYEYLSKAKVKAFPFIYLEFTFLYKPEHFKADGYTEEIVSETGNTKFSHTTEGYEGTFVVFDQNNRLIEINLNVNTEQFKGTGYFKYEYSPATVCLPEAKEVKMPLQGIFEKALDPNKN